MNKYYTIIIISLFVVSFFFITKYDVKTYNIPFTFTSGPIPPIGIYDCAAIIDQSTIVGSSTTLDMPNYIWRHGCFPTSVGMVLASYDKRFGSNFLNSNDVYSQSTVNEKIAGIQHYNDYCLPLDKLPGTIKKDKSQTGGAHKPNNCIADYLRTSFSSAGYNYGACSYINSNTLIEEFASYRGHELDCDVVTNENGLVTYTFLKLEIMEGNPFVLAVDTDGDGVVNHAVAGRGYNDDTNAIRIFDTWGESKWLKIEKMSSGTLWGVGAAIIFDLVYFPPPPEPEEEKITCWTCSNGVSTSADFPTDTYKTCEKISGWYSEEQDCSQPDVVCWDCIDGEAVAIPLPYGTNCENEGFYSEEPDCQKPIPAIPGFEIITLLIAISIVFVILDKRLVKL